MNAIDAFEAGADVLEPAEVRVGIDSLLPLLEEYGHRQGSSFCTCSTDEHKTSTEWHTLISR